jgi:hypothetical protein
VDLLFATKSIRATTTWAEARELLKDHPTFQAVPTDEEREAVSNPSFLI